MDISNHIFYHFPTGSIISHSNEQINGLQLYIIRKLLRYIIKPQGDTLIGDDGLAFFFEIFNYVNNGYRKIHRPYSQ